VRGFPLFHQNVSNADPVRHIILHKDTGEGEDSGSESIQDDDSEDLFEEADVGQGEEILSTPLQYAYRKVCHIITMLYELSATILRHVGPRDRLQKYAAIDLSYYVPLDVKHIAHTVCATVQMIDRLGRANTRRRQLLRYHEQRHARYVDVDLETSFPKIFGEGPGSAENERIPLSEPWVLFTHGANLSGCESPSTEMPSQITVTNCKWVEDTPDMVEVESDIHSQTSFASSLRGDVEGQLRVPDPPNPTKAFEGEPFQCPYCYVTISVKGPSSWK
jgi:hypothetical protein